MSTASRWTSPSTSTPATPTRKRRSSPRASRNLNITHIKQVDPDKRGTAIGAYITFRKVREDGSVSPTQVLRQDADYFRLIAKGAARDAWKGDFGLEMWLTNRIREVRKWIPFGLPVLSGDDELGQVDFDEQPPALPGQAEKPYGLGAATDGLGDVIGQPQPLAVVSPQAGAIDETTAGEAAKPKRRRRTKAEMEAAQAAEAAALAAAANEDDPTPADDDDQAAEEAAVAARPAPDPAAGSEEPNPYQPPEPASDEVANQNPGGMGMWDDD